MARSNEYKSEGGSFENLSDALSSIDELLEDVKRADEQRDEVPEEQRSFRDVISELQNELGACIAELMKSWDTLELDPLYIYFTEDVTVRNYSRNIKFIHPEYEHVWLTEGKGQNVASKLIPFIDYGIVYHYEESKIVVSNLLLDTKLNLPDFKTSLQAAHVDLEILKEDAKRVELVCENGENAHKKITETLQKYCSAHELELEIKEEIIPYVETKEERSARLRKEAEAARKAELEAKKKAEDEERLAKKKAEDEERLARKKAEEEERKRKRAEAKAAREARAKSKKKRDRDTGETERTSTPPMPNRAAAAVAGASSPPPIPPAFKK